MREPERERKIKREREIHINENEEGRGEERLGRQLLSNRGLGSFASALYWPNPTKESRAPWSDLVDKSSNLRGLLWGAAARA